MRQAIAGILLIGLLGIGAAGACGPAATRTPTVELQGPAGATKAVAGPQPASSPAVDIEATVIARVQATLNATPTIAPKSTVDLPQQTAGPVFPPPATTSLLPTPTPGVPPQLTPTPALSPGITPTVGPTLSPAPTPTRGPMTLEEVVAQAQRGVVRIATNSGMGSGVVFETNRSELSALVLTNYHVVEGQAFVTASTADSRPYKGTVVGADAKRDLAVVSICCSAEFTALPFADESRVRVGADVAAIGYALGYAGAPTVTRGIISATRYEPDSDRWIIQTDASINPGNSGGPLLSMSGEILGINAFKVTQSASGTPVEGFGFAISIETVSPELASLKEGAFVAVPAPTVGPGGATTTYVNDKYWYTLQVPSDWSADTTSPDDVTFWEPQTNAVLWVGASDVDPVSYPTLESYVAQWRPAAAEGWTDLRILDKQYIHVDSPVKAYRYVYTYRWQGVLYKAVTDWYLLGPHLLRVGTTAAESVWDFEQYSVVRRGMENAQASFQPTAYTSPTSIYSVAHPTGWKPMGKPDSDYFAYDPVTLGIVSVRIYDASGYESVQQYGDGSSIKGGQVISRSLVYTGRSNPGYRLDYSYLDTSKGRTVRGSGVIFMSGGQAYWLSVEAFIETWPKVQPIADDILLRFAVKP